MLEQSLNWYIYPSISLFRLFLDFLRRYSLPQRNVCTTTVEVRSYIISRAIQLSLSTDTMVDRGEKSQVKKRGRVCANFLRSSFCRVDCILMWFMYRPAPGMIYKISRNLDVRNGYPLKLERIPGTMRTCLRHSPIKILPRQNYTMNKRWLLKPVRASTAIERPMSKDSPHLRGIHKRFPSLSIRREL